MKPQEVWRFIPLLILLLSLAFACAAPTPPSPGGKYYLTAAMTYLRDAAAYDANLVGLLYKGDQVEQLETGRSGWWRVRSGRTGQTGWVAGELFDPTPAPAPLYYVIGPVKLRECPQETCPALQQLFRGDQVQKIEANEQGWWRVLAVESRNLGWLPAPALVETLEELKARPPEKPYLYVAVRRLQLRREPQSGAEVVKLLQVNDQVEKLAENQSGWVQVRQPAGGATGWVWGRYLETLPVRHPRPERRKIPRPRPPAPAETEPEIM